MRSASDEIEVRLDPNLSISGEFFTRPFRECRTLVQIEDESFAAFFANRLNLWGRFHSRELDPRSQKSGLDA